MKDRTRPDRVTIADGREALLSSTLEAQWQNHILLQAALGGFHGFHIRLSAGTIEGVHSPGRAFPRGADHDDASGIPDLLLVNPERRMLLLPELKRTGGRVTAAQEWWLHWLNSVDVVSAPLWRPEHESEVSRILLGR